MLKNFIILHDNSGALSLQERPPVLYWEKHGRKGVRGMIDRDKSILDILCDHQEAQEVFRRYDQVIGECVMCNHLFETLEEFTARYGLDCEALLAELRAAAGT